MSMLSNTVCRILPTKGGRGYRYNITFGKITVLASKIIEMNKMCTFFLFIKNYLHYVKNCIGPTYKKLKPWKSAFIKNSSFENNRDPCAGTPPSPPKKFYQNTGNTLIWALFNLFSSKKSWTRNQRKRRTIQSLKPLVYSIGLQLKLTIVK